MKFSEIRFVKEKRNKEGITYSWYVSCGRNVSDGTSYSNYENGVTTATEFPIERLPKCVQNFISSKESEMIDECDGFTTYIYR